MDIKQIPIGQIEPNPFQYRREFPKEELKELEDSIRVHGVLQPLLLRPVTKRTNTKIKYQIVAGERRYRAAKQALKKDIPAVIKEMDDAEAITVALVENLQRNDPDDWATANGLKSLMDLSAANGKELNMTQVAKRIGKSISFVRNHLEILNLDDKLKRVAQRHSKVKSSLFEIQKVSNPSMVDELIADVEAGASYQDIKGKVDKFFEDEEYSKASREPDTGTKLALRNQSKRQRDAQKEAKRLMLEISGKFRALESYAADAGEEFIKTQIQDYIPEWQRYIKRLKV